MHSACKYRPLRKCHHFITFSSIVEVMPPRNCPIKVHTLSVQPFLLWLEFTIVCTRPKMTFAHAVVQTLHCCLHSVQISMSCFCWICAQISLSHCLTLTSTSVLHKHTNCHVACRGTPSILDRDMDPSADRLCGASHTAARVPGRQLPGWPPFSSPGCYPAPLVQVHSHKQQR